MTIYSRAGWLYINVVGPDGQQHRKTARTKNMAEAKLTEAAFRLQVFSGQPIIEKTLPELIAEVREEFWIHSKSLKHFFQPIADSLVAYFGNKSLAAFGPEDVKAYQAHRAKASELTANRSLAVLKRLFSIAVSRDYVAKNPVMTVPFFREPQGRVRHLSEEEQAAVLKMSAPWPDLYDCLVVAIETGMRAGELFNLRVCDVFLERGCVHLLDSKSGYPRHIPITSRVKEVFERRMPGKSPERKVFGSCSHRHVSRQLADLVTVCQIPACRWHDLRHTFASNFLMRGGRLEELRVILGHRIYATTLRYAHLSPGYLQEQLKFMDGSQKAQEGS